MDRRPFLLSSFAAARVASLTATELAAKHRLPTMCAFRSQAEAGGLMSYGADIVEIWRRAGQVID